MIADMLAQGWFFFCFECAQLSSEVCKQVKKKQNGARAKLHVRGYIYCVRCSSLQWAQVRVLVNRTLGVFWLLGYL